MAVDLTKLIFFDPVGYDKVRRSGNLTTTIGGSASYVNIVNFSDLGLATAPKVYVIIKPSSTSSWKLPGGGTYFAGGRVPVIRVTSSTIQAQRFEPATSYDIYWWVLDTTMKAD